MRLKKLILHGFKSFADRTEFEFDAPIVGIVGPNGCGKSNVVDGFKWVLGEQSAKSLRGDAMMDVIFNGSTSRKPAGMAEVTLVFDNPKRPDGTRFLNIDMDEVTVGRRLFRDGTSEYQLNNQLARLRDIRDLFLDTGIGVDAYSVIEQGKIAAMLDSNPQERRVIFEEAAGISKYKVKKKEAQRKLERVEQNLLRLNDIVEEVEKRLRSVRIQAGRARTYRQYNTRLAELRLSYSLQEYHTLRGQFDELQRRRDDAQFRLDDIGGDLQRQQSKLAAERDRLDATSQARQQAEYDLVEARAQVQSAQQRQQYAQQQLQHIAEQLEAFQADRSSVQGKLAETTQLLESEQLQLQRLTGEVESNRRQIDQRQQALRDGQLQLNQLSQQIEQAKADVLELMRQNAAASSRLSAIEIERRNISAQRLRLAERRQTVAADAETLESQQAQLQQKLADVLASLRQLQTQTDQSRSDAAALGKHIAQLSEQLAAAKEHRSGLVSRQTLLRDLEARREGVSEGVKSVLRQREQFPFVRGIVADLLRVDVEHAQVIEAALNGQDQSLVVDSLQAACAAGEAWAELGGRVSMICMDRLAAESGCGQRVCPDHARPAPDVVQFDQQDRPIVGHLLGMTAIVDDLPAAMELHRSGPRGWRYVTNGGEVIEADGTLRAGSLTAAMGLLSRRSELQALALQIADVDRRIESLSGQIATGNEQAQTIESELNALRSAYHQANTDKVELSSQIAQAGDKLLALQRELPVLDRELQAIDDQISRLADEQSRFAGQKQSLEAEQATRQQQIEAMSAQHHEVDQSVRLCGEQLTSLRVALGQVQEKQLSCQQAVQRQQAQLVEDRQQIERIDKSASAVAARRGSVEQELAAARHVEQTLVTRQQELSQRVEELAARLAQVHAVVAELSAGVESIREQHAAVEQELHEVELQAGAVKVRIETLVQRTMDDLELDLPARYSQGYQPAEMNWDAVADEIKQLRDKIHRLGNVNLDAIGEQDELEQRQQFLSAQVNDLTTSKRQLEELIDTINKESSIRFEQCFNAVREHFQGMFRKLFGGGKADIYLEAELAEQGMENRGQGSTENASDASLTPDPIPPTPAKLDLLDAGIEIIAKPPGKQPCSISQLSGGEKTMTCVALLMSIFKSKPSPFCLLDEVDAALDEANNQRFNLIIQEFLDSSQFIIITHAKCTMRITDVLYGVTMQEEGVSKRVAVRFDQIDAHGRIAEHVAA